VGRVKTVVTNHL